MSPGDATFSPILQALLDGPRKRSAREGKASSAATGGLYSAQGRLALDALSVTVDGCGALGQPMAAEQAQALHATSAPAPFGHREATMHDARVRDTGRIAAEALRLRWAKGVQAALQAEVARALGQPALQMRLHDLLVYGPGQFFKPHQDTEKYPGMVGTLVLAWPSAHIGGTLVVRHGDDETRFASQHLRADALRWCAFYADCRHEVLPVEEGWRVVLTFDLLVPSEAAPQSPAPPAALLRALRARLLPEDVPSTRPWVFLLAHEYSQRGLRWHLLKGEDRAHVSALCAAAAELGLVVHLALAEIHESWTAISGGGYGRRDDYDDHDGSPEPDELIDEDMTLNFWTDSQGQVLQREALSVAPADVESFAETGEDYLVDEQYEGYMGNYGETLDYWYRRAALVLQTPQALQASRFITEFDTALQDAEALAGTGPAEALARRLQAGWPVLLRRSQDQGARRHLRAYATLASALPDAELALELCRGFDWTQLRPEDAATLAGLARWRGAPWLQRLLDAWMQRELKRRVNWRWMEPNTAAWPQDLPGFAAATQQAAWPPELLVHLLQGCAALWRARNAEQADADPAARQLLLPLRLRQATALASAAHGLPAAPRAVALARWVAEIQAQPTLYPLLHLPELLHMLPAALAGDAALQSLRAAVTQALQTALAQPQWPADDQRLEGLEWQCRCKDCAPVIAWAESSSGTPLTLPLAKQRREHVKGQLAHAAAPLRCETLRQGSPYKLVIHKPTDLHASRKRRRALWAQALAALDQPSS